MKKWNLPVLIVTTIGVLAMGLFFGRSQSSVKLISVNETYEKARSDTSILLLDVRTPEEYADGHIANTMLIPVQELAQRIDELAPYKTKTIIAICRSGNRSGKAAELLGSQGYTVFNMEGGMLKWRDAQLPMTEEHQ